LHALDRNDNFECPATSKLVDEFAYLVHLLIAIKWNMF
jgi:hypothetical protein